MSKADNSQIVQASAVATNGRAVLIEGEPGAGKSSLALALIARGAQLIGDDGVRVSRAQAGGRAHLVASPPPHIEGLIEVRGVGLLTRPLAAPSPLALVLTLTAHAERLPEALERRSWLGCTVPVLPFVPGTTAPAERALAALELHGLPLP
ncbi:MAG: serine kinase [Pseudomonadota bacterium]